MSPRIRWNCALVVAMTVVALAASVGTAYASFAWRFAGGRCFYDSGSNYLAYGVSANSLMYPKQSPQDDDWVNSLYARKDNSDWIEAGWYWTPGGTQRVWFTRSFDHLYGDSGERYFAVSGRPDGTRATIWIRRDSANADYYGVWVDGYKKYTWNLATFTITSCRADVGAERYDTGDYNKGSWTYVKAATSSLSWVNWPHAYPVYSGTTAPQDDPFYYFWNTYVDRSDHYVYCDSYEN